MLKKCHHIVSILVLVSTLFNSKPFDKIQTEYAFTETTQYVVSV